MDITSTLKVKHVINYPQIKVHSRQPTTTAIKISIFFLFLSVYLPIPRSYYTLLRYPWFKQKKTLSCLGIAPLHDFTQETLKSTCLIVMKMSYKSTWLQETFLHSEQWTSSHNRFRYKQDFIPLYTLSLPQPNYEQTYKFTPSRWYVSRTALCGANFIKCKIPTKFTICFTSCT